MWFKITTEGGVVGVVVVVAVDVTLVVVVVAVVETFVISAVVRMLVIAAVVQVVLDVTPVEAAVVSGGIVSGGFVSGVVLAAVSTADVSATRFISVINFFSAKKNSHSRVVSSDGVVSAGIVSVISASAMLCVINVVIFVA